jgi:hypothetical protein
MTRLLLMVMLMILQGNAAIEANESLEKGRSILGLE